MKNTPKARQEDLVIQELENEVLIYDIKSNKCFCLNETLKLIWQFCDGKNPVDEISNLMSRKLKNLVSENFILLGLYELDRENLLEKNNAELAFLKSSRREIIKKIGFASIIALPIISSIVAPRSLSAQSINNLPLFAICSPTGIVCQPGLSCRSAQNPFAPTHEIFATRCCAAAGINYTTGVSHGCFAPGTCSGFGAQCCSGIAGETSSPTCSPGFLDCRCT